MSNADAVEALSAKLERLPGQVSETRTVAMGTYRGLAFGVILHPFGSLEAFLDGQVIRRADPREGAGGRALLNALERITGGYGLERERCQQEKAVAEGQLTDYESRLGTVFRHGEYERQLSDLRDKLKAGLSGKAPEEGEPTVAELDEFIKALRALNAVESAPARIGTKPQARAEKPVTARISRTRTEPETVPDEEVPDDADETDDTPAGNVIPMPVAAKAPAIQPPRHAEQVTQRRHAMKQMSLFD
jgi:hypothetical protein